HKTKIIPIRTVQGPFELLWVYNGPEPERLQRLLLAMANLGRSWPYLPLDERLLSETQKNRILTAPRTRGEPPGADWMVLLNDDVIRQVGDRLGRPPLTPLVPPPAATMPESVRPPQRKTDQLQK